jgi:ribosome recycling factor
VSEDVRYGAEEDLQDLTDKYVKRIDTMTERKADEIMEG